MSNNQIYLSTGTILNQRYEIEKQLSSGGFSITYTAWDKTLEMKTVVKEYMPKSLIQREEGTTQVILKYADYGESFSQGISDFLKEARVLARLTHHKAVAGIIDYFCENNTAYIVMPYCEGKPLSDYIHDMGGRIDYQECIKLLLPVMDALADIHREGVIHRDISPDNILITQNKDAVLLDFGSSETIMLAKSHSFRKEPASLKHGYAPPEQYCAGGIQGPWTDVYSMAATFYHCVTGVLPTSAVKRMHKDELIDIRKQSKHIPRRINNTVSKALCLASKDRFQDMKELIYALESRRLNVSLRQLAYAGTILAIVAISSFGGYLLANSRVSEIAAKDQPVAVVADPELDKSLDERPNNTEDDQVLQSNLMQSDSTPTPTEEPNSQQSNEKPVKSPIPTFVPIGDNDPIIFADSNLESAIREAIGQPEGEILKYYVSDIRTLNIPNKGIENLEGMQHFEQLTWLDLTNNMVEDITPIIYLEHLGHLCLDGNLVYNVDVLEGCIWISELGLSKNYIEDISSLSNLKNLTWLDLNGNKIVDVSPLSGLPKLQWLNIAGNKASDISSLANCPRIEELCADGMGVKNVEAFEGHPSLEKLQY